MYAAMSGIQRGRRVEQVRRNRAMYEAAAVPLPGGDVEMIDTEYYDEL